MTFDDASESFESFKNDISEATEDLTTLQTIMSESASGTGVTSDNLSAFKKMFGDDAEKAIEKTANGYHLNTKALTSLQQKQQALVKTNYYKSLKDQYATLRNINEQLLLTNMAGKDTSALMNQRNEIFKNIDSIKDEQMAYEGLTSSFAKWKQAQSEASEHDDFSSLVTGLDELDDLFAQGWYTSKEAKAYLNSVVSEDLTNATGEQMIAAREKIEQNISGTSFSIKDFMTTDDD